MDLHDLYAATWERWRPERVARALLDMPATRAVLPPRLIGELATLCTQGHFRTSMSETFVTASDMERQLRGLSTGCPRDAGKVSPHG